MASPLALIGTTWAFYKKQPFLNEIAFWFFFLPIAIIDVLAGTLDTASAQGFGASTQALTAMEIAVAIPIFLLIIFILTWGQACVLMVAKRLVASPAGRNRTSFKAVRKASKKFIWPLIITELLRAGTTLLLLLCFIIPGIIYSIRTTFYSIILIEKGKIVYGREMLRRSGALVQGRTWEVLFRIIALALLIFIPVGLVQAAITLPLIAIDERLITLGLVLSDFISSFASVFFIVSIVALYADLKTSSPK